jgi:5'-3' exonuclease
MAAEQLVGEHRSIALVDVSYLWKKNWLGMPRDAAPGAAAQRTLDELAGIRESVDHVIICCDSPPYRRRDVFPEYKAQRERPADEELAQKRWLMDRIAKDGYQVAKAKGYEADDVIATLCLLLTWCSDVRIVGSDKDVAQCVGPGVRMFVPAVGSRLAEIRGVEEIRAKYGVAPSDMRLWLALCGDKSDNIPGVPSIGPKKAAALIEQCKTLNGIAEALATTADGEEPNAMWKAIAANWEQLRLSHELTKLETDVPLDVAALLMRREPERLVDDEQEEGDMLNGAHDTTQAEVQDAEFIPMSPPPPPGTPMPEMKTPKSDPPPAEEKKDALAKTKPQGVVTEDLQPVDMTSAWRLASALYNGRLYGKFQSAEAVFTLIVKARELGLKITTVLDGFHVIEGKPSASADMMRALAERHPDCEYFMLIESTPESATWETKNKRHPKATRYTYTIAEARLAGLNGGNWAKRPRDMICKTAASKLARLVYPGATVGLYCPEEMDAA